MGHGGGYTIRSLADGAVARGFAQGGDIIAGGVSGNGSIAMGHTYGNIIESTHSGSVAMGRAGSGQLQATADGAVAMGHAYNNRLTASASGAVAMASGVGSWAAGNANSGNIRATANGAGQFSYGTNNEPDSFAVGPSLRLNSYGGTPSTLRNGDIWTQGGTVYIRSNNITQAI
jgi:hypothetical protein